MWLSATEPFFSRKGINVHIPNASCMIILNLVIATYLKNNIYICIYMSFIFAAIILWNDRQRFLCISILGQEAQVPWSIVMIWRSNGDVPNTWSVRPDTFLNLLPENLSQDMASCFVPPKRIPGCCPIQEDYGFPSPRCSFFPIFFKETLYGKESPQAPRIVNCRNFIKNLPFYHVFVPPKIPLPSSTTNVSAANNGPTGWLPPCWTNGQIGAMEVPRWRHLWRGGVRPEVELLLMV